MNPLLNSVPGDIPGLLRRGSPIIAADTFRGNVTEDPAGCSSTLITVERDGDTMGLRLEMLHALTLDLADATGRAHAAWWARRVQREHAAHVSNEAWTAIGCAQEGADMTPEQIDTLARLILRLAGRSP